jgi:hypothetical protein
MTVITVESSHDDTDDDEKMFEMCVGVSSAFEKFQFALKFRELEFTTSGFTADSK